MLVTPHKLTWHKSRVNTLTRHFHSILVTPPPVIHDNEHFFLNQHFAAYDSPQPTRGWWPEAPIFILLTTHAKCNKQVSNETAYFQHAVIPTRSRYVAIFSHWFSRQTSLSLFTARRNACIASAVLAIAIPTVCLSVCPSVTRRYCVKTTARSTVQFALSDSKMCLAF